jgi:hypothetical protein
MNKAQQKRFNSLYQKHVSALMAHPLKTGDMILSRYMFKTTTRGRGFSRPSKNTAHRTGLVNSKLKSIYLLIESKAPGLVQQ